MTSLPSGSPSPASSDLIITWLADLLSDEQRLGEWQQLPQLQRSAWLSDEGYCAIELEASLACWLESGEFDPSLRRAVERFLVDGEAIPMALCQVLESLLINRLEKLHLAGGNQRIDFAGHNPLKRYREARNSLATISRELHELDQNKLGRYIETVGGLENDVNRHITDQIDTEVLEAKAAVDSKAAPLIAFKTNEKTAYQARENRFITQAEDKAHTAETRAITSVKAAQAEGHHPLFHDFSQTSSSRSALSNNEHAVVHDDRAYFEAHDLDTLQAGLVTKPTWTVTAEGSSRSVSLSYDWKGTTDTIQIARSFAKAEFDPALEALNRLTARALWSARQSAAIASWESKQWPHWQARLAHAHPKVANQLATSVHTTFPKAKLPSSYSQLLQQAHIATAAARAGLQKRMRRAWRHGIDLVSLQRQWDEKRLKNYTTLRHLIGLASQRALTVGAAVHSEVERQLQAMALAVLVSDVRKTLVASGEGENLRGVGELLGGRAERHAGRYAVGAQALRADLAASTATLSFSDGSTDLSWTVGGGIQISSDGKSSDAGSTTNPTLSLQVQSKDESQDSLRLSASIAPSGELSTSYYRSSAGGNVRQFSNSTMLSKTWQLRLKGAQAFGVAEFQAYKASLDKAAREDASADLQQHATALQNHARLDQYGQRALKNVVGLHRVLHDLRVDRHIEARIKPSYGSVRSQKLLINQWQHDRSVALQGLGRLRRIKLVNLLDDTFRTAIEWRKGVADDSKEINDSRTIYKTKPVTVQKNSQGHGYHLAKTGTYKDSWQKMSEKQKYKFFNPIYHSEAIFYKSERTALLAGTAEYTTLRRDGASKKMARLGASVTYFNTLLREDAVLYKTGLVQKKLAYAPFVLRRQLHVLKRELHRDRHPFAWRLRLSWKVKRERFIHKHVVAYEHYMLNNKFTGFHPFHRIARKTMHLVKSTWHYIIHPIVHVVGSEALRAISIFSPKAAKWIGSATTKLFKGVTYLAYHALKALWHLPEHLYHHTIYFGKQLLFAISHPWEYRRIWTGLKKDFKGIYRLGKFVYHLGVWFDSVWVRTLFQLGRLVAGQGATWSSVFRGAYHKKLWHKAKMLNDALKFAGLATLVGKTKATRVAIKLELLRMQIRRDLHHDGFLSSPWHHFVRHHKDFVHSHLDDLKSNKTAAVFAAYQRERAEVLNEKKAILIDFAKYKANSTYKAEVQSCFVSDKKAADSLLSKLKPRLKASMHSLAHDILNEISGVSDKAQKIRKHTVRAFNRDISQLLWTTKRIHRLGSLGRKELLTAVVVFKDLNRTHKSGVIKSTLQAYSKKVQTFDKNWKKYFKTGTTIKGTYAYAVTQDWLNVGQQIGGQLLMALQFSFKSSSTGKAVAKDIRHAKIGEHIFDDIMGGFWIHHYEHDFAVKNAALLAATKNERQLAESRLRLLEMVVTQPPVHKLLAYWLKRNSNSVVARDMLFVRALDKKIHKWERIEKIGHYKVSEQDILSLQSLHKSQMLGASLAETIARTSRWQSLNMQQQAEARNNYENWLGYNQSTYHGLDRSYSKFQQKDASEAAAWQSEQAEIASGESLSVGTLLVSVRTNDTKHTKWAVTPKPSLVNATQHLEAAAANLATLSHDPQLLAVSLVTHAPDHSSTTTVKPNPSLWAYMMQIKHWSHKIKKKLADKKAAKEKAEKEAKEVKETEDAKQDLEDDQKAAEQQAEAAEQQLNDGSADQQQLAKEAKEDDAPEVNDLVSDNRLDQLSTQVVRSDSGDPARQLQQLEDGTLKSDQLELQQAELREQDRVQQELRQAADEDPELRDLRDGLRVERDVTEGDFKQDLKEETTQLLDRAENRFERDLRASLDDMKADADEDLVSGLINESTVLDDTLDDIEADAIDAEEDLSKAGEDVADAAADCA